MSPPPQEASHPQIRAFSSLLTRLSSFVPTEAALRSLLGALTSEAYDDTTQHLEREQALAKQFAEILHFTLRFDELKVRRQRPHPLWQPSRPNRRRPPQLVLGCAQLRAASSQPMVSVLIRIPTRLCGCGWSG